MDNDYQYRVALVNNKKLYKIIKDYKKLKHAKNKFNKFKAKNQVLFPKFFTNYQKINRTNYEVLLLQRKESDGISSRQIFEDGKVLQENVTGDWKIVDKVDYNSEEEFYVYGLKDRLNVAQLLQHVFVPRFTGFYQVLMVLNKIVIVNDGDIEVILTKNLEDCQRLYDFVFDFLKTQGFYSLLFLGTANKKTRSALYDKIQEHTGLTRKELYRTSTRS